MFELAMLIAVFLLSIFIGAGMYVGGLMSEWTIGKLHNLMKPHK